MPRTSTGQTRRATVQSVTLRIESWLDRLLGAEYDAEELAEMFAEQAAVSREDVERLSREGAGFPNDPDLVMRDMAILQMSIPRRRTVRCAAIDEYIRIVTRLDAEMAFLFPDADRPDIKSGVNGARRAHSELVVAAADYWDAVGNMYDLLQDYLEGRIPVS